MMQSNQINSNQRKRYIACIYHLELIRNKRKTDCVLDEDVVEFLSHAHRENTHRMYNTGWRKWNTWCEVQDPIISPTVYNELHVLRFLLDHRHLSYQYLNGLRSSIASVFKVLHPEQTPIAGQDCIIEFFKAKKKSEINIPKKHKLQTWDTTILVAYIKQKWPHQKPITLYNLQQKTLVLLCLTTMARPRSDIGRLQFRDVHLELENKEAKSVIIHFREAKEAQVKSTVIGLLEDRDMCLVSTLFEFIQKSCHLRSSLPTDHSLFLAYINEPTKITSASPSTVASWVSQIMTKAGVDTKLYKPHSIRSASSTKAVENGITIDKVKQHANWSQRSNTFEKYYLKPTAQQNESTNIANSIFSPTGKHTTLESESQSTRIVEGTTNNASVDEDEDENVVTTHPWLKWWKNL